MTTGTSTDVAKTCKRLWAKIYAQVGITPDMCWDICILVMHFDNRTKFDAIVRMWSKVLNFGNIPFSISQIMFRLMTEYFVWENQSHIGICSVRSENCKYWAEHVDYLTKDYDAAAITFGLYNKIFPESVKVFYYLQPRWLDRWYWHKYALAIKVERPSMSKTTNLLISNTSAGSRRP